MLKQSISIFAITICVWNSSEVGYYWVFTLQWEENPEFVFEFIASNFAALVSNNIKIIIIKEKQKSEMWRNSKSKSFSNMFSRSSEREGWWGGEEERIRINYKTKALHSKKYPVIPLFSLTGPNVRIDYTFSTELHS